ncbi:MAG: bifunctional 4-hydroxy-2-oxoglutarate aldolase/2-dehydro-3-deoxy-phosphogluconate aldolase [Candidatus Korobacteraceae bacterium]
MTKAEIIKKVVDVGVVPVVRAASAAQAIAAAEAVCAGGISVVEVTMTVPGAVEVIAQLVKTLGSAVVVGAGTVLDAGSARRCLDAGAQFLVSPGFDLETVKFANSQGVPMMAGALSPTEVITAWNAGSDFVKIFPCGNVGGAKYIKALKGPLPQIPMIPTGGVNLNTAAEFIQAGSAAVGVGGELVLAAALKSGNTREITELAKQYVTVVREARAAKV